jgi:phenylacetate-CoA ligase
LIGGVLGRADDMITVRGINVFPSAIENIVRRHPQIVEFEIEVLRQREMHELRLNLEIQEGAETVIGRLQQEISNDLRIRVAVVQVRAGSLPRFELKSRRLRIVDG